MDDKYSRDKIFNFFLIYNVICVTLCRNESCLKSNAPYYISNVNPQCNYIDFNVSSDLVCSVVVAIKAGTSLRPTNKYFKIEMKIPGDHKEDTRLHSTKTKWCTGIRSAHIFSLQQYPAVGQVFLESKGGFTMIDYHLEGENWKYLLEPLTLDIHMNFDEEKSYGFAQVEDACRTNKSETCVPQVSLETFWLKLNCSYEWWPTRWLEILTEHYITKMGGAMTKISQLKGIKLTHLNYLNEMKIEDLNLSNNYFISSIDNYSFQWSSLINLNMSDSRIKEIQTGNLKYSPRLRKLDLSNNELQTLPEDIGTLTKLQYLDLSVKQDQQQQFTLPQNFTKLTSLRVLKLSHLNLCQLTRENLPARAPLSRLHLDFCGLRHLPPDVFMNFTQLTFLTLRGNQLSALHLLFSVHAQRMNMLDAAQNALRDLADVTLQHVHVDTLDLSRNVITNCNARQTLPVRNLNLSVNLISVINDTNMACFDTYDSIDFGANRFSCRECSIREFQRYIRENKPRLLWFSETRAPQCYPGNVSVSNVKYDEARCEIVVNVALISGATLGAFALLALVFAAALYHYRFQVTYVAHLLRVRRALRQESCLYDLFVSYCSEDRLWVLSVLCPELKKAPRNYNLCLHEKNFVLGAFIIDNFANCIAQSRHVMCVLSTKYLENEWCHWQLDMAQHHVFESSKDFLLLVELERLDRAQLPLHLKMLMTSQAYLEWHAGAEEFWLKLERALGKANDIEEPEQQDLDDMEYYNKNPQLFVYDPNFLIPSSLLLVP